MTRSKWKNLELEILKESYGKLSKFKLLELFPNRTYDAIKLKAAQLGLKHCDNRKHDYVRGDLSRLLDDNFVSYYWAGFLMADGNCTPSERIRLRLSLKDQVHISKFAKFVDFKDEIKLYDTYCSVSIQDKYNVPKIRKKHDWHFNKTENPPDLSYLSGDLLIAYFIGFIDGDGSIRKLKNRKDSAIMIKVHSSWLANLQFFADKVCEMIGINKKIARLNKQGYAVLNLTDSEVVVFLKRKTESLNLPVLDRKWDRVDQNFESRYKTAIKNKNICRKMLNDGFTLKEISTKMRLSFVTVYNYSTRILNEEKDI
jgi:hypothetical protein